LHWYNYRGQVSRERQGEGVTVIPVSIGWACNYITIAGSCAMRRSAPMSLLSSSTFMVNLQDIVDPPSPVVPPGTKIGKVALL
jgi:hypothetical protein